jgi:hypothetical protein
MVLDAGMSVLRTEFVCRQGAGGQVQAPTDDLGNLADGHRFVTDGVEHRAGRSLLDGQPVQARGALRSRHARFAGRPDPCGEPRPGLASAPTCCRDSDCSSTRRSYLVSPQGATPECAACRTGTASRRTF